MQGLSEGPFLQGLYLKSDSKFARRCSLNDAPLKQATILRDRGRRGVYDISSVFSDRMNRYLVRRVLVGR